MQSVIAPRFRSCALIAKLAQSIIAP